MHLIEFPCTGLIDFTDKDQYTDFLTHSAIIRTSGMKPVAERLHCTAKFFASLMNEERQQTCLTPFISGLIVLHYFASGIIARFRADWLLHNNIAPIHDNY
jgi:hypothetical protein